MLIKHKDDVEPALQTLEGFLALKALTGQQRGWIEEEMTSLRAGSKGEKEAAYHIDFKFKDARNWVVIHDLRLEHNGRVAQIDHLVIGRFFDVFVIESKNLQTAVRVNKDDEFEVNTRWGWKGMASPVEQNKRHIQVLSEMVSDEELMPSRLGIRIRPKFHNWVLIAPECNLMRGKQKEATISKMDMFDKGMEQFINHSPLSEAFTLAKMCSTTTVLAFAEKLVNLHQPIVFDYAAKFGITEAQRFSAPVAVRSESTEGPVPSEKHPCEKCQVPLASKVVAFCRAQEKRFGGRVLCRTCQAATTNVAPISSPRNSVSGFSCQECERPVDAKVIAFCRSNGHRFNKKVLCRICQASIAYAAR